MAETGACRVSQTMEDTRRERGRIQVGGKPMCNLDAKGMVRMTAYRIVAVLSWRDACVVQQRYVGVSICVSSLNRYLVGLKVNYRIRCLERTYLSSLQRALTPSTE